MDIKFFEEIDSAVTVCNSEGVILFMNKKAKTTFENYGGGSLIGKSLFDCHNERSISKIKELISSGGTNAYTIEKNGLKKLIFQTVWTENGKIMGLIEFSHVIPMEMPHFVRG